MRLSDLSERLELVIGSQYCDSWRKDMVLPDLGLSVDGAVSAGVETSAIWRAVCNFVEVPATLL
ncbi:MAG: DUF3046 domain-containing protein [Actinomycetia bacterium]|jgi:hypothetical protein|nr:DUF3046 domain-containing protein [Actinomycetes bacterium]MCH9738556.1 DUF3046 domain-containing protein [Actinomycetes bacterium]MCH9840121.1 DUF3046 domain-containing protein [Actinomycetes bacterium]